MVFGYSYTWDYEELFGYIKKNCDCTIDTPRLFKLLMRANNVNEQVHLMMEIAYLIAEATKPDAFGKFNENLSYARRAEKIADYLYHFVLNPDFFYEDCGDQREDNEFDDNEDIPTPDEFVDCPHTYEAV